MSGALNLAELESIEREFRDEHNQAHPFFGPGNHFKPLEDKDKVEIEDEEPGASDFDTVDNQEGKRKPISRIPSKKRNKSKKKKKKNKRR